MDKSPVQRLGLAIAALAVIVLVLWAAGQITSSPQAKVIANNVVPWTRSANYTTCDQWASEMSQPQRESMARDLLPILRSTVDSAASDGRELVPSFVVAISATCQLPEIKAYDEYMITAAAAYTFTAPGGKAFQP